MAYRVRPRDQTAQAALRRIACSQIDRAIAGIDTPGSRRDDLVHGLRRRMKKLRALIRLVRPHFDRRAAENAAFRDIARLLSAGRDTTVMRQTLETLLRAWDEKAGPGDAARLRRIVGDHVTVAADAEAALSTVRDRLGRARERAAGWRLDAKGLALFADGLETSYRRARKAMAAARTKPVAERLHEWRKRVKDHYYHLSLLRRALPRKLRESRTQFDLLGELLGDLHDLAMLRERICAADGRLPHAAHARLLAAIDGQAQTLTARSFDLGTRLFHRKPKAFARGVRQRLAEI